VSAAAQVSVGIRLPGVSIGINVPRFPDLVAVPGYPVYYAPELDWNFFFYDGLYWIYTDDQWYASSWYDGPWDAMDSDSVPYFILRVPVRYYRRPPVYFRGWAAEAPPRWGEHWGRQWEQRRAGWDRWDRASAPAPAPLPTYQRNYSGDRYPGFDQQYAVRSQNYHYEPREPVVRREYQKAPERPVPTRAPVQSPEHEAQNRVPANIPRGNTPPSAGRAEGAARQTLQPSRDERRASPGNAGQPQTARPDRGARPREPVQPQSREQKPQKPGNARREEQRDKKSDGKTDRDN
jgi:hypothetical protein